MVFLKLDISEFERCTNVQFLNVCCKVRVKGHTSVVGSVFSGKKWVILPSITLGRN